jgi:tryptophanyl-tRNA synthetase
MENTKLTLGRFEKQEPFFIYTGRGPSSNIMHIGHMVPFELTKWLSDVFQVPVIVMLTDGMARHHQVRIIRFAYVVNDQMKSTLSVNRGAA